MQSYVAWPRREFPERRCLRLQRAKAGCSPTNRSTESYEEFASVGRSRMSCAVRIHRRTRHRSLAIPYVDGTFIRPIVLHAMVPGGGVGKGQVQSWMDPISR